jgi:hypothetical protein
MEADWLLPKIHHAGFPAQIVETDAKQIEDKYLKWISSL